jgi:hypothetical protein
MQPTRVSSSIGNLAERERGQRFLSKWTYLFAWMILGFYGIYQLFGVIFTRNVNIFDMIQCPIDVDEQQMNACIAAYKERMSLSGEETFNRTTGSIPLRLEASVPILSELLVRFPNRQIFSRFSLQAFQCPYCVSWLDYWLFMLPSHILMPYLKTMTVLGFISHGLFDSEQGSNVRKNLLLVMMAGISLESLMMLAPGEQMNLKMGWPMNLLIKYVNPWSQAVSNATVMDRITSIRKGCFAILAFSLGWFSYKASRISPRIQGLSDENVRNMLRCLIMQRKMADILGIVSTQKETPIDDEELRSKWIQACHLSEDINERLDFPSEILDFSVDSECFDEDLVNENSRQMLSDQPSIGVETSDRAKSIVEFPAEKPKGEHVE